MPAANNSVPGLVEVCAGFSNGELRHDSHKDITTQLLAEGRKRIASFVFEAIFRRNIRTALEGLPGCHATFGWHVGFDASGRPAYLFRLMERENDWNPCDNEIVRRVLAGAGPLTNQQLIPVRILFDEVTNTFVSALHHHDGWVAWEEASSILRALPGKGKPRGIRNMDNTLDREQSAALDWLFREPLVSELHGLSVQRRMMNCLLGPLLGRDACDLDAIVLTQDEQLRYFEFKRKYPAADGSFGIDERPHVVVRNALAKYDFSTINIVLVPPYWESEGDPVEWIDERSVADKWTWIAINLDGDDAFSSGTYTTSGSKSGQRSFLRTQFRIDNRRIRELARKLKLEHADIVMLRQLILNGDLDKSRAVRKGWLIQRRVKRCVAPL